MELAELELKFPLKLQQFEYALVGLCSVVSFALQTGSQAGRQDGMVG